MNEIIGTPASDASDDNSDDGPYYCGECGVLDTDPCLPDCTCCACQPYADYADWEIGL